MVERVLQTKALRLASHKLCYARALRNSQAALKILMKLESSLEFGLKAGP